MAFLDFIRNRNAAPQQPVAPPPQPEVQTTRSIESLPDNVKAQAVEAARPAARLMDEVTTPRSTPPTQSPQGQGRGRSLGMER